MLTDWIYWLSSIPVNDWWLLLLPLMFFDSLRYLVTVSALWVQDFSGGIVAWLVGKRQPCTFDYEPPVSIVIAGLNEADSLQRSLLAIYNNYPKVQLIIVDDGSTDGMGAAAQNFADQHENVKVISKRRGGKSSALNAALPFCEHEIVVVLDADSGLGENAIHEIVQPLSDPGTGAVSGNVHVRNRDTNLLTLIQSFEYQRSIFLGRMVSARLGILGIVSGAFGAFRLELLRKIGGWDVGPGEDEDIVLRIRKLGFHIEFAPYADCFSDAPTQTKVLARQRRRWEWAIVTFVSRKHIELANVLSRNFRLADLVLTIERWVFGIFLPLAFLLFLGHKCLSGFSQAELYACFLYYVVFALCDFVAFLMILYYSNDRERDSAMWPVVPVMPFYQFWMRLITLRAVIEEMLMRRSFKDGFVPEHVRKVTWHW